MSVDPNIVRLQRTGIVMDCPAGTIRQTIRTTADIGWLLFNQTVTNAQTQYPALWEIAPAGWKVGTSLVLPDLTDRVLGGAGTVALGATGGANTKTIVANNLPVHTHPQVAHSHAIDHNHASVTSGIESANHVHNVDPPDTEVIMPGTNGGTTNRIAGDFLGGGAISTGTPTLATGLSSAGNNAHVDIAVFNTGGMSVDHTHDVDLPNFTGSTPSDGATTTGNNTTTGAALDVTPALLAIVYQIRAY